MENGIEEYIVVDGVEVFTKTWTPSLVKATVSFVHGFGEHVSRTGYSKLFNIFFKNNIKVHAYDQVGFGKTSQKNCLVRGHNEGWERIFTDVTASIKRTRLPNTPHFLMGHSMVSIYFI